MAPTSTRGFRTGKPRYGGIPAAFSSKWRPRCGRFPGTRNTRLAVMPIRCTCRAVTLGPRAGAPFGATSLAGGRIEDALAVGLCTGAPRLLCPVSVPGRTGCGPGSRERAVVEAGKVGSFGVIFNRRGRSVNRYHCAPMPPWMGTEVFIPVPGVSGQRTTRSPTFGMEGAWEKSPSSAWVIEFEFLVGFVLRQPFEQRVERELQQWKRQQQQPVQQQPVRLVRGAAIGYPIHCTESR